MRSFYQDRFETNIGKALKKDYRFLRISASMAAMTQARLMPRPSNSTTTRKRSCLSMARPRNRVFLRCHFILKMIILSRQARDKHRESTQKKSGGVLQVRPGSASCLHEQSPSESAVRWHLRPARKRPERTLLLPPPVLILMMMMMIAVAATSHAPWPSTPTE